MPINFIYKLISTKEPPIGLMEAIQPLVNQISELQYKINSNYDINTITFENIRSFINNAPVSLMFLDDEKNIAAYSKKCAKWLKQFLIDKNNKAEDLTGLNFYELTNPCPKELQKLINSTYKGNKEHREIVEFKKGKSSFFIRWESSEWRGVDREVKGVVIFIEDVTKKHLLALSNKKLQQCNLMLEKFALIFSHDLVQPVRQISNYLNLITSQVAKMEGDKEFFDFALNAINKSMSQIKNLSEGIVLCCKNGDLTIDPEIVSLFKTIEEIRQSCLLSSDKVLSVEIEKDIHLYANRVCVTQLLQNLITNAVKYSPTNNSVVVVKGKELDNGFYQISIHNHGAFPVQYLKKFKTQSLSSSLDGTGLGLIICKRIVAAYKGEMSIESGIKKGTVVTVSLPIPNLN